MHSSTLLAATKEEVLRGAGWAWGTFVVLMLIALSISQLVTVGTAPEETGMVPLESLRMLPVVLGYALVIGGGVAFVVMVVYLPVAWGLARALRSVSSVAVHAVAFAVLGALVGVVAVAVYGSITHATDLVASGLAPSTVAITTLSVLVGWWLASAQARKALRNSVSAVGA